jgi:hypothetical protein
MGMVGSHRDQADGAVDKGADAARDAIDKAGSGG